MSTITLPNIRVSSDLTVKVRLKDSGVAIDWSTLTKIKASIYSDAQRALAGRCDVSIDAEDSTLLVCSYAANKPQYVGVNRVIVSAKYMGETKTYDKPAFNFVRWTADQEGEEITIDDPDVDVEISVEDISSSILQEAVDEAFTAADRANDAAAAAEHMVDIHTGPEGKSAYEVAVEEGYTGTEEEWLASLVGPQGAQGIQGETGEAAGFGTVSVSLQEDGGQPSATVAASGTDTAKNFAFTFNNLKGDKGDKGDQGNTGSSVDYPYELVNNLTTNDATKGLTAAMGVTLEGEVSQLEAKVDDIIVKPEWLEGYEDANLFHTRACKLAEQGKYVYVYGGTIAFPAAASYNTYLLAVDPTKKYKFKNIRFGVPVKADKTTPCSNTVIENATLVDMSTYTDVAYIYFSFNTGDYNPANYIVSEGETLNEEITLPEWFGDWVNELVNPTVIPDGGVTTQQLANNSVSTEKIQDSSITPEKLSFYLDSKNLFNPYDDDVALGYYQAYSTPSASPTYNLSGYIRVSEGQNYAISRNGSSLNARFVAYFDEQKNFLSSTENIAGVTTIPNGVSYIRLSIDKTQWTKVQFEKGNSITDYVPYRTPSLSPQIIPAIPIPFASFRDSFEVASNETKLVDGILSAKSLYLSAEIFGTIEEVIIGVGNGSMYGSGVKITPTQMLLVSGSSLSVDNTYNHGLTLGTMTKVVIHREQNELIYVDLYDDAGNTFRGGNRNAYIGMPFVINNGTNPVNISVSQFNRDANTPILVCGDSYWSMADSRRITDNLLNYGCKGFQLYARGGIDATGIYPSLQRTIEQGAKPKYIIWDIGMNGGADSNGAVNTSWLSYTTQFLALCDNAGITPVLCTIPSVPSQIHTKLNEWVRASGRRYIDLDSEVKAISGYYWRGWGTADALLSSDEVHPTTAGAKQLALRIMVDFPEIAVL